MSTAFEDVVLPHLDSAYRFALWLLANGRDAEDAVEEAARRAHGQLRTFDGTSRRAWFLGIVRATCSRWLGCARPLEAEASIRDGSAAAGIKRAIAGLPLSLREVIVLRDLEDLSYRELADVIGVSVGTAASRLSYARRALHAAVAGRRDAMPPFEEERVEVCK